MSVIYELSKNEMTISVETVSLNALYDEEFEFNKRSHHEQIAFDLTEFTLVSMKRVTKKKSQKRIDKKSESQFLINMFDDALKAYEKSISIRQILKVNKINMSLLN
jgi:hypothetical protein